MVHGLFRYLLTGVMHICVTPADRVLVCIMFVDGHAGILIWSTLVLLSTSFPFVAPLASFVITQSTFWPVRWLLIG